MTTAILRKTRVVVVIVLKLTFLYRPTLFILQQRTRRKKQSQLRLELMKARNTLPFYPQFVGPSSPLRVFCYSLSSEYRPTTGFGPLAETFFGIKAFFEKYCHTDDPLEADLFFVPLNLIQFQFRNEDPVSVLSELRYLSKRHDHILVALGDFSQRSKKNHYGNAYRTPYKWLDDFILLALESTSDLIPGQDIGIIPLNTLSDNPSFNRNARPFLYSFLGETNHAFLPETHVRRRLDSLKQSEDCYVGKSLSPELRGRMLLNYHTSNDHELLARNSIFTLCPAGYGKWTYRFFQSIQWGSIPVLISDDYIKPFGDTIPYDDFAVTVPEKEISEIDGILRSVEPTRIAALQENLRDNQHHFTKQQFFQKLIRRLKQQIAGRQR